MFYPNQDNGWTWPLFMIEMSLRVEVKLTHLHGFLSIMTNFTKSNPTDLFVSKKHKLKMQILREVCDAFLCDQILSKARAWLWYYVLWMQSMVWQIRKRKFVNKSVGYHYRWESYHVTNVVIESQAKSKSRSHLGGWTLNWLDSKISTGRLRIPLSCTR